VKLKVELTPYMATLVDELVKVTGKSRTACIDMLLFRVEQFARNGEFDKTWGHEWVEVSTIVNARGLGAQHEDPVMLDGGEEIAFDIKLLEKSGRAKTGFAGVYATTGNVFRALVPDTKQGGSRYLKSHKTALNAAIERFEYFERFGIPYGNVGIQVESLMKRHPEMTIATALADLRDGGLNYGLKDPYTIEEVEATLARHCAVNGIPVPPIPPPAWVPDRTPRAPGKPKLVEGPAPESEPGKTTLDIVTCSICKDPIEEGEPFSPQGRADFAHSGCL
jgi:hypothetical protein